jgi:hypothetical protein
MKPFRLIQKDVPDVVKTLKLTVSAATYVIASNAKVSSQ